MKRKGMAFAPTDLRQVFSHLKKDSQADAVQHPRNCFLSDGYFLLALHNSRSEKRKDTLYPCSHIVSRTLVSTSPYDIPPTPNWNRVNLPCWKSQHFTALVGSRDYKLTSPIWTYCFAGSFYMPPKTLEVI